jgi:hypothetical protein
MADIVAQGMLQYLSLSNANLVPVIHNVSRSFDVKKV